MRHLIFYNNCLISRSPIGSFLPSVGVQTNKILIYTSFQVSSVFSCQIFNFLTSGVLLTFIGSQSKSEKSYKLATIKLFSSSLIVYGKFTASFPLIYSRHLNILGSCYNRKNKLTSVFYTSVFLLMINCVIIFSKFTTESEPL